jgi:hypothetical protein
MSETARIREVLDLILQYGGIDGVHHKQWVLDQIVRILTINEGGYKYWCEEYAGDPEDEENYYGDWDVGIPP